MQTKPNKRIQPIVLAIAGVAGMAIVVAMLSEAWERRCFPAVVRSGQPVYCIPIRDFGFWLLASGWSVLGLIFLGVFVVNVGLLVIWVFERKPR
jgi:hypothetical protein